MQVGTTKDQGLYNKLSATVHPGALAAGTLPQYNTIYVILVRNRNLPDDDVLKKSKHVTVSYIYFYVIYNSYNKLTLCICWFNYK